MKNIEIKKRDEKIIELSKTLSQKEIGKMFGLTPEGIGRVLRKYGIKRKKSRLNMSKLSIDIDYFKTIDTPKKAYWLGFITADGSINKNNNKLTIICKDLEILEKFKTDIKSEHKISNFNYHDKRTDKTYYEYSIQITNELFVNNIIEKGITNKKSDKCEFPKIEEELYSYFIAGLFDGDGSVSLYGINKNRLRCNLISTKEILNFINEFLKEKYQITSVKMFSITKNKNNVFKQHWYKDSSKFLNFIYQGNKEIYLTRKYKIYEQYK